MRKSFDGLCGLVSEAMHRHPTSGEVYVFLNKKCTQIKLLHWEYGGYVLYYKRLERGTFRRPSTHAHMLSYRELLLMIEGIFIVKSRQKKRYILA